MFSRLMLSKRRQTLVHMLLSIFLVFILLFSGCLNQKEPKNEETNLPSLQRQQLSTIQQHSLDWFTNHFNGTTGSLENVSEPVTIRDRILAANVLISYADEQTSFTTSLNKTIEGIIQEYQKDSENYSLLTSAQLLDVLCTAPLSFSSQTIRNELADRIIQYQQELQFNSTTVLTKENAIALTALIHYDLNTQNESIHELLIQLIYSYHQRLTSYYEQYQTDDAIYFENQQYYNHYFTPSLMLMQSLDLVSVDPVHLMYSINQQLSQLQETQNNQNIGQYTSYNQTDSFLYQLEALQSMNNAYNFSITLDQKENETLFKQSLILGLIYLKNQILQNDTRSLSAQQHLTLLPVIQKALRNLPSENWTYLWDSSNQLLLEGRELETSSTVWTALSIGVMGSIGLLALVFIIIQLYYKNKK